MKTLITYSLLFAAAVLHLTAFGNAGLIVYTALLLVGFEIAERRKDDDLLKHGALSAITFGLYPLGVILFKRTR